jgi:serine/threonine-protein kinase
VDAVTGHQLWGNQYSRKFSDVLAVEEEIVRHVSMNLRLELTGSENERLTRRYAQSVEAYHAYLKGRHYRNQWSLAGFKKGLEFSRQAVDIDPSYAQGWAGLAFAYYAASNIAVQPDEAMPKASKAAQTALEIDDSLVEAHTVLALVKSQYEWDWIGAEREFKRAIELGPNDEAAHASYGCFLLLEQGRFDEAIAELTLARRVDPLSSTTSAWLTYAYYLARNYDETIRQCRKIIDADANNIAAHYNLGMAYEEKSMFEEAIVEFQKARQLDPDGPAPRAYLGHAFAVSGRRSEAYRLIDDLKEQLKQGHIDAELIAEVYAGLGEKDQAFEWLEKSFSMRSEELLFLKVKPRFDNLRSDTRFTDLVRRVGLTP